MAFSPDQALAKMEEARQRGRLAHAYLVTGAAGAGKQAFAARLAARLLSFPETESLEETVRHQVFVVRPASVSRRIRNEQIHDVQEKLRLSTGGRLKIIVIVDADRMNEQAQNTFLRTLEEPPPDSLILLLSARPETLLTTILSRCIELGLHAPAWQEPEPNSRAGRLLAHLARFGTLEKPGARSALTLARYFASLLAEIKEEMDTRAKKQIKEEKERYQKTTGAGNWLDEREMAIKALASADYLAERSALHSLIVSWFGDALRIKAAASHLDLPSSKQALSQLATNQSQDSLLRRIQAMERLRDLFETNVSEPLAIEVCFLRAFS